MFDFSRFQFHPVIQLPSNYEVYDFSAGYNSGRALSSPYGIGKYDEDRRGMYDAPLFKGKSPEEARTIHMGVDIGAPVGTPVKAFFPGEIFLFDYNGTEGDYGNTVITRHDLDGTPLYALHGHLSGASLEGKAIGNKLEAGQTFAWVGDRHENGGWNPHLHFQLSWEKPASCDMPGVVSAKMREKALSTFPDPRLVLGKLY